MWLALTTATPPPSLKQHPRTPGAVSIKVPNEKKKVSGSGGKDHLHAPHGGNAVEPPPVCPSSISSASSSKIVMDMELRGGGGNKSTLTKDNSDDDDDECTYIDSIFVYISKR
jgi:hypothetical protein